ncbi:MAG: RNA pseudouridine synthase [Rhodothalassiaceae bacterium]
MTLDLTGRILYRDGLVVILDKPAGIAVHRGPSGRPSLEDYFDQLRFGLPRLPALAHRLDADTSGCLVLGRHPKALRRLARIFSEGLAQKTYLAVLKGRPPEREGRIAIPLLKISSRGGGWHIVADPAGKHAITDYRILAANDRLSVVKALPRTGRTHQLRVHFAELGCPILGDPRYGTGDDGTSCPLHLHAQALRLPLYPGRDDIDVNAPIPAHIARTLADENLIF